MLGWSCNGDEKEQLEKNRWDKRKKGNSGKETMSRNMNNNISKKKIILYILWIYIYINIYAGGETNRVSSIMHKLYRNY